MSVVAGMGASALLAACQEKFAIGEPGQAERTGNKIGD
jgi:hypothetical protein